MRKMICSAIAVLVTLVQAIAISQSRGPQRSAVDVTNADVRATLKGAPADGVMDQQIRVVDIGKYNVAIGVLHRAAKAKQTAIEHSQVAEVYHIIEGSGTFVTGGDMVDPTPSPADGNTVKLLVGPSTNGSAIRGGQSRKIGPGDVIVIPPVQHRRIGHELSRGARRRRPRAASWVRQSRHHQREGVNGDGDCEDEHRRLAHVP